MSSIITPILSFQNHYNSHTHKPNCTQISFKYIMTHTPINQEWRKEKIKRAIFRRTLDCYFPSLKWLQLKRVWNFLLKLMDLTELRVTISHYFWLGLLALPRGLQDSNVTRAKFWQVLKCKPFYSTSY